MTGGRGGPVVGPALSLGPTWLEGGLGDVHQVHRHALGDTTSK